MMPLPTLLTKQLSKWLNILFGAIYPIVSMLIIEVEIGSEWNEFFVFYNVVELFGWVTILW